MLDPGNVTVGQPCPPGAGCVERLGQVSREICVEASAREDARETQQCVLVSSHPAVASILQSTVHCVLMSSFPSALQHSIRALALRVLREILRNQPARFKNYAELTIMKTLEAHKDCHKEVSQA